MALNHRTQSEHQTALPPPPWSSLLSLVQSFELHKFFPWTLNLAGKRGSDSSIRQKSELGTVEEPKSASPPPPKKVGADDPARITNPLVVFPVYAIGGFIILKWVLARWKERQERAKKPDDDNPSTEEYHEAPADHEE